MIIRTKARRGRIPRAFQIKTIYGGENFTTTAAKINKQPCSAWRCSAAANATHVSRPGGEAQRLCQRHLREAERQELTEQIRRELSSLFRRFCPRVALGLGGTITALVNRLQSHKPLIVLARIGAETDSEPEPCCPTCGTPLADNWLPHSPQCDTCSRYRPAPPGPNPPPEPERCSVPIGRTMRVERRLSYAA
jgi:hypothetical protein